MTMKMRNLRAYTKSVLNPGAIWLFAFFVFMQLTTWIPLRYWRIWGGGNFIDSQQILQWARCYKTHGNAVFRNYGECPGYVYGSTLLRILSFSNLGVRQTQIFGYLFMIFLAVTISLIINNIKKIKENPIILLIVLSPPVLLLAERGNFDIMMFSLVVLAALIFVKNHQIWALFPLATATLLKFYTLPVFLVFFLLNRNTRLKLTTLFVAILVAARVLLDLKLVQSTFPSEFPWKFGSSIWARYLVQLDMRRVSEMIAHLSGLVILALIVGPIYIYMKKSFKNPQNEPRQKQQRILFYVLAVTHMSCFLLGMSFDYRLIFLAMASIVYVRICRTRKESQIILVLGLVSVWLTYPSNGLEPVGDLATEILTVVLGIRCAQLIKSDMRFIDGK